MLEDPALRYALYGCVLSAVVCWVLSIANRNYSQVDRIWSLAPPIYVTSFAASRHFADVRLDLMAVLVTLWGARLTYNFARKGGYRPGGEDYRWPILRKRLGPVWFQIFNATFIAPFQNFLLLMISLPAFIARGGRSLGIFDVALALVFVMLLVGETIADQQQWRFHEAKRRGAGPEFLESGLFRYSRHPNFFCEIGMWWCAYFFSVAAGAPLVSVGLVGPVLLTLLFQGSTTMTEAVSRSKYPRYADYQRSTSRLIPLPPFAK